MSGKIWAGPAVYWLALACTSNSPEEGKTAQEKAQHSDAGFELDIDASASASAAADEESSSGSASDSSEEVTTTETETALTITVDVSLETLSTEDGVEDPSAATESLTEDSSDSTSVGELSSLAETTADVTSGDRETETLEDTTEFENTAEPEESSDESDSTSATDDTSDPDAEWREMVRTLRLEELVEAEERWLAQGLQDYEWHVENACFSCFNWPGHNVRVVVQAGEIISILSGEVYQEPDSPFPVENAFSWHVVEGLFAQIRFAIERDVDNLDANYDEVTGVPSGVYIDRDVDVYDDEDHFIVLDFQPLVIGGDQ